MENEGQMATKEEQPLEVSQICIIEKERTGVESQKPKRSTTSRRHKEKVSKNKFRRSKTERKSEKSESIGEKPNTAREAVPELVLEEILGEEIKEPEAHLDLQEMDENKDDLAELSNIFTDEIYEKAEMEEINVKAEMGENSESPNQLLKLRKTEDERNVQDELKEEMKLIMTDTKSRRRVRKIGLDFNFLCQIISVYYI